MRRENHRGSENMPVRAVRGAITVERNEKRSVLEAASELLSEILKHNRFDKEDAISVFFTATKDITKVYPAEAARELGLTSAALMCQQEMYVEGSLEKCIRVLMHVETDIPKNEINHIYLKGAVGLRPDLSRKNQANREEEQDAAGLKSNSSRKNQAKMEEKQDAEPLPQNRGMADAAHGFAVAIDGPSGAGKSTVAKILAKELGIIYVDTGAMYRALALYGLNNDYDLNDKEAVESFADDVVIELKYIDNEQRVFLNGEDVTKRIRLRDVTEGSSKVALIDKVRKTMTKTQREIAAKSDVVMDGRDIGTDVLPDAQVKIYMDAAVSVRAKRRLGEFKRKGVAADLSVIEKEITERDRRDMDREISPLRRAQDAIYLDTGKMTAKQVASHIRGIVSQKRV